MNRLRNVWLVLGGLWVAAIVYLSLAPQPPQPMDFSGVDKLEHAVAYATLVLLLCQSHAETGRRIYIFVLAIALGAGLEILQGMSGYRHFEYSDILANSVGATLGLAGAYSPLPGRINHILQSRFFNNQI